MDLLLDTHTFIWMTSNPERIPEHSRAVLIDETRRRFLSIASVWEMAIKASLGKLDLGAPIAVFVERGMDDLQADFLPIDPIHALRVASLPLVHRDPFDRLLVAQALVEKLTIVSCDLCLDGYGVERLWLPPTVH
jgi:PIN domain nuclease of toxin-antitoxin system